MSNNENQISILNSNKVAIINSKQSLIENVQKWVLLDSQLKIVTEKTHKMRDIKNELATNICTYMKDNNLTTNKIGISDGELRFYDKKEYTPLSYKYIEKCLIDLVPDKSQVEFIIQYLKEHRETTSSLDIRRTYHK